MFVNRPLPAPSQPPSPALAGLRQAAARRQPNLWNNGIRGDARQQQQLLHNGIRGDAAAARRRPQAAALPTNSWSLRG